MNDLFVFFISKEINVVVQKEKEFYRNFIVRFFFKSVREKSVERIKLQVLKK